MNLPSEIVFCGDDNGRCLAVLTPAEIANGSGLCTDCYDREIATERALDWAIEDRRERARGGR